METISKEKIKEFQTKILDWYKKNKRDLPWRKTNDPYKIHLSEIMLQQTQVERVKDYYIKFLQKYPTLEDLSKASQKDLLLSWQGLGYNNRILRLQQACKKIKELYNAIYPTSFPLLQSLDGVGPYTAGAICAFAFNKDVSVVDTNIRRIIIGEFDLKEDIKEKDLEKIALQILPKNNSKIWYNALMDYGAIEYTAKKTNIKSKGKQGKFKGSTREARSKLLKYLLQHNKIKNNQAQKLVEPYQLIDITSKMQKDGLLICEEKSIYLKS